ncbi:MAG: hypothetical protein EA356_11450 [Geminicoccaceae bacterium]|nr:MAG: hypothetical protein EA356_11450 [Geminicoccaceae bacterium]
MDSITEERIRQRAFELSEDPARAHLSDIDNWLDAERLVLGGLAEDEGSYQPEPSIRDTEPVRKIKAGNGAGRRSRITRETLPRVS